MKARAVRRWTLVICAIAVAGGVMATSGSSQTSAPGRQQSGSPSAGETRTPTRYVLVAGQGQLGTFSELRGLSTEVEVTDYMSAGDKGAAYKRVAGRQAPKLTLKRAHTKSEELWAWHEAVVRGDPMAQRNVTLAMQDAEGRTVASYYLESAFPSKIEVGTQKVGSSETLTETVTVVGQHIQRLSR